MGMQRVEIKSKTKYLASPAVIVGIGAICLGVIAGLFAALLAVRANGDFGALRFTQPLGCAYYQAGPCLSAVTSAQGTAMGYPQWSKGSCGHISFCDAASRYYTIAANNGLAYGGKPQEPDPIPFDCPTPPTEPVCDPNEIVIITINGVNADLTHPLHDIDREFPGCKVTRVTMDICTNDGGTSCDSKDDAFDELREYMDMVKRRNPCAQFIFLGHSYGGIGLADDISKHPDQYPGNSCVVAVDPPPPPGLCLDGIIPQWLIDEVGYELAQDICKWSECLRHQDPSCEPPDWWHTVTDPTVGGPNTNSLLVPDLGKCHDPWLMDGCEDFLDDIDDALNGCLEDLNGQACNGSPGDYPPDCEAPFAIGG